MNRNVIRKVFYGAFLTIVLIFFIIFDASDEISSIKERSTEEVRSSYESVIINLSGDLNPSLLELYFKFF